MEMRQTRKVWFNIYPNGQSIWPSKEKAQENARSSCIAIAVETEISFVTGNHTKTNLEEAR